MDEVKLQLLFARHAESLGNVDTYIAYERNNPPLTQLGVKQAQLLGERLSCGELNAIFSSPLTRAVQTAHAIAQRQKNDVRIELLPELMEVGTPFGVEGCSHETIKRDFPLVIERKGDLSPLGGGLSLNEESSAATALRAEKCVDYLLSRFTGGEKILVVSHGEFTSFFMRAALGLSNENAVRWCSFNTGLFKIKYYKDGKVKLAYSNDTSHLYPLIDDLAFRI